MKAWLPGPSWEGGFDLQDYSLEDRQALLLKQSSPALGSEVT